MPGAVHRCPEKVPRIWDLGIWDICTFIKLSYRDWGHLSGYLSNHLIKDTQLWDNKIRPTCRSGLVSNRVSSQTEKAGLPAFSFLVFLSFCQFLFLTFTVVDASNSTFLYFYKNRPSCKNVKCATDSLQRLEPLCLNLGQTLTVEWKSLSAVKTTLQVLGVRGGCLWPLVGMASRCTDA